MDTVYSQILDGSPPQRLIDPLICWIFGYIQSMPKSQLIDQVIGLGLLISSHTCYIKLLFSNYFSHTPAKADNFRMAESESDSGKIRWHIRRHVSLSTHSRCLSLQCICIYVSLM
jgi:hypothetical protein